MKIIDCEIKGTSVKFYLGDDKDNDYWGDDWDDAPYEHNCGSVYHEYVKATKVVHFPFNSLVLEPCDGVINSSYCRDDFKNGKVPCILVVPEEVLNGDWHDDFAYWASNDDPRILRFYFNDKMSINGDLGEIESESFVNDITLLNEIKDNIDFKDLTLNVSSYKKALRRAIKCLSIVEKAKRI